MKILHVVSGLQKASGVTTFVENVVAELRTSGHAVDVVTRQDGTAEGTLAKAYDVVHVHGLWDPWLHRWAKVARKSGVKVVWSPHGMLTSWAMHYKWPKKMIAWHLYQKRDLQLADAIHVTVPSEEKDVRRVGLTSPVIVVPLGVRMADFASRPVSGGLVQRLLFTGRVTPIKGLANVVEALPLVEGWRLRIVGPDQDGYAAELKALAEKMDVADRIDFAGPKYDEELAQEYQEANCFILPSFSENFGSVVVEALAAGLPVIASKGTPWSELEERKCGWWVENDPETLAAALREAMALSDEERAAMGARGRALVAEKYQWPAIGARMLGAYGEILV